MVGAPVPPFSPGSPGKIRRDNEHPALQELDPCTAFLYAPHTITCLVLGEPLLLPAFLGFGSGGAQFFLSQHAWNAPCCITMSPLRTGWCIVWAEECLERCLAVAAWNSAVWRPGVFFWGQWLGLIVSHYELQACWHWYTAPACSKFCLRACLGRRRGTVQHPPMQRGAFGRSSSSS